MSLGLAKISSLCKFLYIDTVYLSEVKSKLRKENQMSSSELWPREAELMCAHSKNATTMSLYA